jgi:hypothetical protein
MGGKQSRPFQLSFNVSLKIDFQGSRVSSDDGSKQVRKLDERLGFGELIEQRLTDSRGGENMQLPFADLRRQKESVGRTAPSAFGILGEAELAPSVVAGGT